MQILAEYSDLHIKFEVMSNTILGLKVNIGLLLRL